MTPALELNASCGLGLSVMKLKDVDTKKAFVMVPGLGMEYSLDATDPEAVALSLDARYSMANYGEDKRDWNVNLFTVAAGMTFPL